MQEDELYDKTTGMIVNLTSNSAWKWYHILILSVNNLLMMVRAVLSFISLRLTVAVFFKLRGSKFIEPKEMLTTLFFTRASNLH